MTTILLVEDNDVVREILTHQLAHASHHVITATNGEEAVELLKTTQPTILITDIIMPKMDGIALISEVKNKHPAMEIIAISSNEPNDSIDYLDLSESLGAAASFEKPVDKTALLMVIDLLLHKIEARDSEIDWSVALSLAGNNREFAEKMLGLLIKDLSEEIESIKKAYVNHDQTELSTRLHKLHGALCYCGAVKLKIAVAAFEKAIRHPSEEPIPALLLDVEVRANQLIKEVRRL